MPRCFWPVRAVKLHVCSIHAGSQKANVPSLDAWTWSHRPLFAPPKRASAMLGKLSRHAVKTDDK